MTSLSQTRAWLSLSFSLPLSLWSTQTFPAMQPVSVWQWSLWGLLLCLLCSSCLGSPSPSTAPEKRAESQGLRFRLAGFPRKPFEGRVEIERAGEWGTICDDDFTLQAAHVLCRELGFTEATGWTHSAKYGPGTGRIWLDNLSCSGTEKSVTECASRGWGNSDCTHDEDAGVICKDQRLPGFSDFNVIEVCSSHTHTHPPPRMARQRRL